MHETHRVYADKLTDDKDIDSFVKMQNDIVKKSFEGKKVELLWHKHFELYLILELDESIVFDKPNIYCHFAGGIGEPKYMPITDWGILSRLLAEALAAYNDLVSAMNLVLFEDAMMHICR